MLMDVENLKVHPKNSEYFSEPTQEEYETLKRSIAEHGIRDPLKVLPDGTVIAGSLRLRVAKELDFTEVPVEIWDVPDEEAEYLLVADNEERRFCKDPMRRAKRTEFLTRYWKIRLGRGGNRRPMDKLSIGETVSNSKGQKTIRDVAEAIGEDVKTTWRLLTLNRLIPEFQEMVSAGTLSVSKAYEIALLDPDTQKALLQVGEERLSEMKVKQVEDLRKQLAEESMRASEAEKKIEALKSELEKAVRGSARADQLEAEIERLRRENEKLKSAKVERIVEKVVYRPDPEREAEIARLREEIERLREPLDAGELDEEIRRKRWELERLKAEEANLDFRLKAKRSGAALMDLLRKLMRPLEKAREEFADRITTSELSEAYAIEMRGWVGLLRWYAQRLEDTTRYVDVRVIRDMLEGKGESGDGDGR